VRLKSTTKTKSCPSAPSPNTSFSHFFRLRLQNFSIRIRQFFKFENPTPVQTPATIINPTLIYPLRLDFCPLPMFSRRKCPPRLLLLSKLKSDSGSGFSQIFDCGSGSASERKTQNSAGVDSGTPDPVPPLLDTCSTQRSPVH